jgi:hypothetical protein
MWIRHDAYLLLFDDGQATLDEGEGLGRAQDGLPLALVGQITVGLAALRERALEDELVCKQSTSRHVSTEFNTKQL